MHQTSIAAPAPKPRTGPAYNLPAGPPVFPPSPQLTSKLFESSAYFSQDSSGSGHPKSAIPQSPLYRPMLSRLDKRPRETAFVDSLPNTLSKRKLSTLIQRIDGADELELESDTEKVTLCLAII